jgi:hypothetical protein
MSLPINDDTIKDAKNAVGKQRVNTTVDDATDNDPEDSMEKIVMKHGWPSDDATTAILVAYFKSRETKKTFKAVTLALISSMPWIIYLILDKVFD